MAKKRAKNESVPAPCLRSGGVPPKLLNDLRDLIQATRLGVAQAVNSALVLLYWQVGHRIRTEILNSRRAGYGEQVVPTLAAQLALEFGQGFAEKNLRRMIQLAEVFPDQEIVVTLSRQLGWSHFLAILPLKDPLQRNFYAEMCRISKTMLGLHQLLLLALSSMVYTLEIPRFALNSSFHEKLYNRGSAHTSLLALGAPPRH